MKINSYFRTFLLFWEILFLKLNPFIDMKKLVQWACSHCFSVVTLCSGSGLMAQPVVNVESTDYGKPSMLLQNEGFQNKNTET